MEPTNPVGPPRARPTAPIIFSPGPKPTAKKEEPVRNAGVASGAAASAATLIVILCEGFGITDMDYPTALVIVGLVGTIAPVVAAYIARMHVFAHDK